MDTAERIARRSVTAGVVSGWKHLDARLAPWRQKSIVFFEQCGFFIVAFRVVTPLSLETAESSPHEGVTRARVMLASARLC